MTKRRRRRRDKQPPSWEEVGSVCAWCGKQISDEDKVVVLPSKTRPGVVLNHENNVIELSFLDGKRAWAIIPTEDSEAKEMGWDLLFIVCSDTCGRALKETLETEVMLADEIWGSRDT